MSKHEIVVSEDKIKQLMLRFNEEIVKIERLDGHDSFCNPIFGITCKSKKEYVLKVTNPLKKWEKVKTINEAKTMQFIRENTSIPVPKIYAYSTSKKELGYEYILMEKINGTILKEVFEKNKKKYLAQIADIIREFQKFSFNKIGSFQEDNSIGEAVDLNKGPFRSFKDWLNAAVESRFMQMQKTRFKKYIPKFKKFLEIIDDEELPIFFCHGDLAPKNMIEKNGKIIAVFDFEWSGAYPYVYDAANYYLDFKLNKEETTFFNKLLDERKIIYKIPEKIRDIKKVEEICMIFVSYKDWFQPGEEEKAEKDVEFHEKNLIKLFEKYGIL